MPRGLQKFTRNHHILLPFGLFVIWCSFYFGRNIWYASEDTNFFHTGRHLLDLEPTEVNCTPRDDGAFPADFLSKEQALHGGIIIHIAVFCYLMAGLTVICSDYFVPSLERMCIAVFLAESDVGVGTILGSAIFNLLFIISVCALFSGTVIKLTTWPLTRDMFWYSISVVVLTIVLLDGLVYWYEGLVMIAVYIAYCFMMFFNTTLSDRFAVLSRYCDPEQMTMGRGESDPLLLPNRKHEDSYQSHSVPSRQSSVSSMEVSYKTTSSLAASLLVANQQWEEEYKSPFKVPLTPCKVIWWVVMLPVTVVLALTIPDCRRPGCWRRLWPLTLLMAVVWLAVFTYVIVWMVTIIGDTFGIPDTVMGLTLLAAGTSLPDAISSLIVAREGLGDMAVSNAIASNIVDILVALGVPWIIKASIWGGNSAVVVASDGLVFSTITLLLTIAFVVVTLICTRRVLTKPLGVIFMVVYVVMVALSCLYMMGVFGGVNVIVYC